MTLLAVALGGALGSALRFLSGLSFDRRLHWGTLLVNVLGSFLLGALVGHRIDGVVMALLGVGFCGGVTTYSSFAVQSMQAPPRRAAAYVVLSIGGCLTAGWLGLSLGSRMA